MGSGADAAPGRLLVKAKFASNANRSASRHKRSRLEFGEFLELTRITLVPGLRLLPVIDRDDLESPIVDKHQCKVVVVLTRVRVSAGTDGFLSIQQKRHPDSNTANVLRLLPM